MSNDHEQDRAILQTYARTAWHAMDCLVRDYGQPPPDTMEDDREDFDCRVTFLSAMFRDVRDVDRTRVHEAPSPTVQNLLVLELVGVHLNLGLQDVGEFARALQGYVDRVLPAKSRKHGRDVGRLILAMLVTYRSIVPELLQRVFESAGMEVHELDEETAAQLLGARPKGATLQ